MFLKIERNGISLVAQWFRLQTPNAGGPGSVPGQGTRSHMLQLKGFLNGSAGKESACSAGDTRDAGSIPGSGRTPPEKEMATRSSILAWRTPRTEEPGRLHTDHGVAKTWTQLSN